MTKLAKFLLYSVYVGIIFLGIGVGWATHPGWGLAAFGVAYTAVSFAIGYDNTPKEIERVK